MKDWQRCCPPISLGARLLIFSNEFLFLPWSPVLLPVNGPLEHSKARRAQDGGRSFCILKAPGLTILLLLQDLKPELEL